MNNHDETMNKVHRYARGLFGETDYHEALSPHLENLQPQYHKMLAEQIGAQSTRRNQKGYDPKAAFVTALMNTMNYQLNPEGEEDRHQDEIDQQFTQSYDQYEDNYDASNEHAEDAGHHGSEVNWDTHPGSVFAAKLGAERATVLGYHLAGNKMQGEQDKYWHALENKLRSKNDLLYSIPQHVTHEQYEKAIAHGGGDNLIQAAYSALSSDDAMKSHGYSEEKDKKLFEQGKLSSAWLAKDILGENASEKDVKAFEERLLAGYGKAKRQSDVDFGMHGVQSGFKTDLLRSVLSPSQLPDFMTKPSEQYTKEDWNKVRSYNFALGNISKMLFQGGDQEEVASRKSKFDAFKGNEFSEIKDELARVSDNDAATYITTSTDPTEKEREQRYNELEAMGLEKTGENLNKLEEVYEGSRSVKDLMEEDEDHEDKHSDAEDWSSQQGDRYGRNRRGVMSKRGGVTVTASKGTKAFSRPETTSDEVAEIGNIIKDLKSKYPKPAEQPTQQAPVQEQVQERPPVQQVPQVQTSTQQPPVPTSTPTPAKAKPAKVGPVTFDDAYLNEVVQKFQSQVAANASAPMDASGHVNMTEETIKDDDATANRILTSMGLNVSSHAQRSPEWHDEKRGKLSGTTAQALTKNPKAALNESFENYVGVAQDPQTFHSSLFERGEKDEPVIQEHMEKLFKERGLNYGIGNSGFISNPEKENYGYSPDGIIYNKEDDSLVGLAEYKSVDKVIHGGDAWNKKYMAQVQLGMHVTGAEKTFHTQLGKAEWENGKLVRPSYTAEVARDPNFNPEEHEYTKRKKLIDSYRGMREDKDLVGTISGMNNEQIRKMSNLTGIAENSSDTGRIKEGLLEAFEQMAQDGGDKYPQLLSNRKAEEAKQQKEQDKTEAKAAAEKEEVDEERKEAIRKFGRDTYQGTDNVIRGIGDIFGGGMMSTLKGTVDFVDRFGGIVGTAIKTATALGESAFTVGDEVRDRIGTALDAGYTNTYEHHAQQAGMQMLGMDQDQARKNVDTIANVRNLATIGETGPLGNLLSSFRGLLHTEDVMRYGSDPEQLVKLLNKRAKDAGYSQEEMAGMATKSGMSGLARSFALGSEENYGMAEERIQHSREKGTQGTDSLREWSGAHARGKPENTEIWEDTIQSLSENGKVAFEGLYDAANLAAEALRAAFGGSGSGGIGLSDLNSTDQVNDHFRTDQAASHKVGEAVEEELTTNPDGSLTPLGQLMNGGKFTVAGGISKGKGTEGKGTEVPELPFASEYKRADVEALEGWFDLSDIDNEIADVKDIPDTDLYKGLMKTIRGSTKEKVGEVDVKVTIIGDDTASIKVSKGNRLLTERKVRFTQTSN